MLRDKMSTNPNSAFSKDDRPLKRQQNPKTKRWEVVREDAKYEEGGKLIARELPSRDDADAIIERENHFVPRTDSTRTSRTRKTFWFDKMPDGLFEKAEG